MLQKYDWDKLNKHEERGEPRAARPLELLPRLPTSSYASPRCFSRGGHRGERSGRRLGHGEDVRVAGLEDGHHRGAEVLPAGRAQLVVRACFSLD